MKIIKLLQILRQLFPLAQIDLLPKNNCAELPKGMRHKNQGNNDYQKRKSSKKN